VNLLDSPHPFQLRIVLEEILAGETTKAEVTAGTRWSMETGILPEWNYWTEQSKPSEIAIEQFSTLSPL
jgi:hypothetical protein